VISFGKAKTGEADLTLNGSKNKVCRTTALGAKRPFMRHVAETMYRRLQASQIGQSHKSRRFDASSVCCGTRPI